VNKAIPVGVGIGIAVIVVAVVGIYAIPTAQEKPPATNEFGLGDKVEMKIEKATEETLEPTGGKTYNFTVEETISLSTQKPSNGTKYNFTVEETIGLGSP